MPNNFIKKTKAMKTYLLICNKLKRLNADVKHVDDFVIIKNKIGKLHYFYNSKYKEEKLFFNGQVVFNSNHYSDRAGRGRFFVNIDLSGMVRRYFSNEVNNIKFFNEKEIVDKYLDIIQILESTNTTEKKERRFNHFNTVSNRIGHLSYERKTSLLKSRANETITLHYNNEKVFEIRHHNNDINVVSYLYSHFFKIKNELDFCFDNDIVSHLNSLKNKQKKVLLKYKM